MTLQDLMAILDLGSTLTFAVVVWMEIKKTREQHGDALTSMRESLAVLVDRVSRYEDSEPTR